MRRAWLSCTLALAVVMAACSSGTSGARRASGSTASTGPTTSALGAPSATTIAVASTCGSASTAAGTGGKGDVAPPGDIPDNQAFVAYAAPAGHYAIKVPEGWARTDQGTVTVFTDKLNTIRIETFPTPTPPSMASVQAQDVPALKTQSRCFEGGAVTTAPRKAGTTVLVTYKADGTPDPVTGKIVHDDVDRYAFWNSGTEAVVTLSSPPGSDNVDPWRTVTDSFAWTA